MGQEEAASEKGWQGDELAAEDGTSASLTSFDLT